MAESVSATFPRALDPAEFHSENDPLRALFLDVEPPSAAGLDDRLPMVTYVDDRLQLGMPLKDIASELYRRTGQNSGKFVAIGDLFATLRCATVRQIRAATVINTRRAS